MGILFDKAKKLAELTKRLGSSEAAAKAVQKMLTEDEDKYIAEKNIKEQREAEDEVRSWWGSSKKKKDS